MAKLDRHHCRVFPNEASSQKKMAIDLNGDLSRLTAEDIGSRGYCAERWAGAASLVDGGQAEVFEALQIAARMFVALFELSGMPKGSFVEVDLGIAPASKIAASGPNSMCYPSNWLRGFYCALATRQHGLVTKLCQVPTQILGLSSTKENPHVYKQVEAFRSLWLHQSNFGDLLIEALEATNPDRIRHGKEYALLVSTEELGLVLKLTEKDPAAFNADLLTALENHRVYWEKVAPEPDHIYDDARGFLALGPLGLACLAHDLGIRCTVDSDYLPRSIVNGQFVQR